MTFDYTYQPEDLNEDSIEFEIEAEYTFAHDSNYGADADGNRGVPMTFLDDYRFYIYDENGDDVTDKIERLFPSMYAEIEQEVVDRSEGECDEF